MAIDPPSPRRTPIPSSDPVARDSRDERLVEPVPTTPAAVLSPSTSPPPPQPSHSPPMDGPPKYDDSNFVRPIRGIRRVVPPPQPPSYSTPASPAPPLSTTPGHAAAGTAGLPPGQGPAHRVIVAHQMNRQYLRRRWIIELARTIEIIVCLVAVLLWSDTVAFSPRSTAATQAALSAALAAGATLISVLVATGRHCAEKRGRPQVERDMGEPLASALAVATAFTWAAAATSVARLSSSRSLQPLFLGIPALVVNTFAVGFRPLRLLQPRGNNGPVAPFARQLVGYFIPSLCVFLWMATLRAVMIIIGDGFFAGNTVVLVQLGITLAAFVVSFGVALWLKKRNRHHTEDAAAAHQWPPLRRRRFLIGFTMGLALGWLLAETYYAVLVSYIIGIAFLDIFLSVLFCGVCLILTLSLTTFMIEPAVDSAPRRMTTTILTILFASSVRDLNRTIVLAVIKASGSEPPAYLPVTAGVATLFALAVLLAIHWPWRAPMRLHTPNNAPPATPEPRHHADAAVEQGRYFASMNAAARTQQQQSPTRAPHADAFALVDEPNGETDDVEAGRLRLRPPNRVHVELV